MSNCCPVWRWKLAGMRASIHRRKQPRVSRHPRRPAPANAAPPHNSDRRVWQSVISCVGSRAKAVAQKGFFSVSDCAAHPPKFHHGDAKMHKLTLALATLAVIAGVGVTRADSSGHMSINGLAEELPRSYDALAPLADGLLAPKSPCAWDQTGAMPKCPTYHWRRW